MKSVEFIVRDTCKEFTTQIGTSVSHGRNSHRWTSSAVLVCCLVKL